MSKNKNLVVFVSALAWVFFLSACAAGRPNVSNGADFARAGLAYLDAVPAVLDDSFALTVEANSLQLDRARTPLSADERSTRLSIADGQLEQRLALLNAVRSHAELLRSYFVALQALSTSDNGAGIGATTREAVSQLQSLRSAITAKPIGKPHNNEALEPAVSLVVGGYRNMALKRELAARGGAIERELALQQAVMSELVTQMQDDAAYIHQIKIVNPVREEYVSAKKLSSRWSKRRVTKFTRSNEIQSLEDFNQAATALHGGWIDFVEKRRTPVGWKLFMDDIERLLAVAGRLSSKDG